MEEVHVFSIRHSFCWESWRAGERERERWGGRERCEVMHRLIKMSNKSREKERTGEGQRERREGKDRKKRRKSALKKCEKKKRRNVPGVQY